jgi:hypothetical protein
VDRRIFVQIPAYRDPELGPTLRDLFAKALRPEALRVAVLWQRAPEESLPAGLLARPGLEVVDVPHTQSRGCNWARHQLQQLWRGEAYTLILDSHHRFVRHWDQRLIDAHDALVARGIGKPIVTAYLPPYEPQGDARRRARTPLKIYPFERADGLLLRLIGRPILGWRTKTAPVPGEFVSLHCLFATGDFNREIPFDPHCYFFGDEVGTSLRAFTAGWDIFHPHRVIGWHCYDRGYRPTHWDDHASWSDLEKASLARLRKLLSGRSVDGYGAGEARSLREFEDRVMLKLCEPA